MFSEKQGNVLHGILLIVLFSFSAFYIAEFQFIKNLSLSPLIVGIILGMLYANSLRNRLPETWVPGIKFCSKQVLRAGIVLYGFRLTFQSVIAIGASAILIDVIIVTCTILLGILVGKLLNMDNDLALLTATGSAICGAAAVLGAEPVVKSEPHKTAVAVFRHALDIHLSHSLPSRSIRPHTRANGTLHRLYLTRSSPRGRGG